MTKGKRSKLKRGGLTEDWALDGGVWDAACSQQRAERAPNAGSVERDGGPVRSQRGERNANGNEREDGRWKRLDDSSSRERHATATCRDVT